MTIQSRNDAMSAAVQKVCFAYHHLVLLLAERSSYVTLRGSVGAPFYIERGLICSLALPAEPAPPAKVPVV